MRRILALSLSLLGCAHVQLSGRDLDQVKRPAWVSRIEENAGPLARVFREDESYADRLKRLDPREADRRLALKLASGVSRFEVSERVRAGALGGLPQVAPWTQSVPQASVHTAFESFLVEEVPAHPPDYAVLKSLGADAVVEIVVKDYGLRSEGGRAQVFVEGYGRMFLLGGGDIWRWPFRKDLLRSDAAGLDPFDIAREPTRFREALTVVLDEVGREMAKELSPTGRTSAAPPPVGLEELKSGSDSTNKTGTSEEDALESGPTPLDPKPPDPIDAPKPSS
ncbi:MAG: hypothetical protein ACKVPX_09875 [Myxococcaceae bacterium]